MSKWRETTLAEIALDGDAGFVDGPFGSNLPAKLYTESGIPVIRGSNLTLGPSRFDSSEFVYVAPETAKSLQRSLCVANDIVFTKKGTLGQTGLVPEDGENATYLLSSNQMRLRVDTEQADALFVYYLSRVGWVSPVCGRLRVPALFLRRVVSVHLLFSSVKPPLSLTVALSRHLDELGMMR